MTTKIDDKCKQCGACRTCDFCACCDKCRECGKAKPADGPSVNPLQVVPLPYPVVPYPVNPVVPWRDPYAPTMRPIWMVEPMLTVTCGGTYQ